MRLNLISLFVLLGAVLGVLSAPLSSKSKAGDRPTDLSRFRHTISGSSPHPRPHSVGRLSDDDDEDKNTIRIRAAPYAGQPTFSSNRPDTQSKTSKSPSALGRFFKEGGWKFWNKNKQATTQQSHVKPIEVHVQTESDKFGKIVRTPAIRRPARYPHVDKGKEAIRRKPLPTPPKQPLRRPAVHPQGPRVMRA